jgi:hypothetical protein
MLLRKGAIARDGKAFESKGVADLSDTEILQQLKDKFQPRSKEIQRSISIHELEEELQLKLDKIMSQLH